VWGVQRAFGELHDTLGIEKGGHGFFRQLLFTIEHLRDTHFATMYIVLAVLVIIVGCEFLVPRFPGAFLAVIGMTAASAYFHWADQGIHVVGAVPSGLPYLGVPPINFHDVVRERTVRRFQKLRNASQPQACPTVPLFIAMDYAMQ